MSSRPLVTPLSALAQAEIAQALPRSPRPGVLHQIVATDGGRRLAVAASSHPAAGDAQQAFAAGVARRADARAARLLPVVSAGCHDTWHWVAYECGGALPLAGQGWRRWAPESALALVADLAGTLDSLAADGIYPYELPPTALFIDPRFGPLLADLGTAREAFGEGGSLPNTPFGPPEVLDGEPAGARTSVWAAGAILYMLLAGEPPKAEPVTRRRPDLPPGIDLVLARALATDSLERYATVTELCMSAGRALNAAEVVMPPAEDEPAAVDAREDPAGTETEPDLPDVEADAPEPEPVADERPPLSEPPARDPALRLAPAEDYEWRPPEPAWLRPLRALAVVAALAAGVIAGLALTGSDPPAGEGGAELTGDGAAMTLPRGWEPGIPRGRVMVTAYPSNDWLSGLSASIEPVAIAPEQRTDPVRLGDFDAWRDTSGAPSLVRYRAPTADGTLVVSCEASSGAAPGTLALCERAASTLRLERPAVLPLPGVANRPGIRAAVARLNRERAAGRARLARARAPRAQRTAATAIARAYARASRRLASVPEGDPLATTTRRASAAYAAMARAAARGERRRWNAARAEARRAEAAIATQLESGV